MWDIKRLDLTTKKQTLMENLAVLHSFVGTGPIRHGIAYFEKSTNPENRLPEGLPTRLLQAHLRIGKH
jgi:hypothetical protein